MCVSPKRNPPIVTPNTFQYVSLSLSYFFHEFSVTFSFNYFGTFPAPRFLLHILCATCFSLVAFVACSLRHFRLLHCKQLLSAPLSLNQIPPFICTFSCCLISLRYSSAIQFQFQFQFLFHHSPSDAANFQFYSFVKATKMSSVRAAPATKLWTRSVLSILCEQCTAPKAVGGGGGRRKG
jgi:hypothetical protein